ncbi:hypothetical protein B0T26DRAFT_717127 [Lasiosphaeria miniovina]|uniref:Uncharacterized protein n=1 Tax=Lasiosphaeria miniovina TaxID=1954250 RepID=A0AA40DU13_9PEZI|nr:uncharacterized protein B0T26DRAFT_717127 [Lasiosphaeria miniovina]KAK0713331.1 hypothetical protein B0T26DRAFT_717127 [Lasiosphaeria miniovina]
MHKTSPQKGWKVLFRTTQPAPPPLSVGHANMSRHLLAWNRLRRLFHNRLTLISAFIVCSVWLLTSDLRSPAEWPSLPGLAPNPPTPIPPPKRMSNANYTVPPLGERVLCVGPRGHLLTKSPDDDLKEIELEMPYPTPFTGSYEALGIDLTFMSADGRYGPYGFGAEKDSYTRQRVDWDRVDWARLQNDCFERNAHRFPPTAKKLENTLASYRFSFRNLSQIPEVRHWHEFRSTRRTAVVVRVWRGYEYMPEDMFYLRSLVAEAALKTGGEYQVILLVDMKDYEGNIFGSSEEYLQGLKSAGIPPEFQSMALLWDDRLLSSWYPDIEEHRTMWQVYQPMQLLALHYPEYDHFWQVELDMRFTGDAGRYLDRLTSFARNEPRKQAFERSTFMHMQQMIGDYDEFFNEVDKVHNGSAVIWGPLRIPEIQPIGPDPPTRFAKDEHFKWGVGEEADVIVTSFCNNVLNAHQWVFQGWLGGFSAGLKTPRFFCPPAIMRTSRALLFVIHEAQIRQHLRVPSEATPPSFALWHGLKFSFPQHPVFWHERDDFATQEKWWKGGPAKSSTGIGPDDIGHPRGYGLTFWWETDWPRQIYNAWQGRRLDDGVPRPWILQDRDGQIYAPSMLLHPMKHSR